MIDKLRKVAPPRVGSGAWCFVLGTVALLLGGVMSAGGQFGMPAIGFLVALGAGLIAVGFWTRLFHQLEQRLVDIQTVLVAQLPPAPSPND